MTRILRGLALVGVGAAAMLGQGCVSLAQHEAVKRENMALRRGYESGDAAVGRLKRELDITKSQLAGKESEIAALKHRLGAADTVFAGKLLTLEEKYRRMLEELQAQGAGAGAELAINPKTGGAVLEDDIFFSPGRADLRQDKLNILDDFIGKLSGGDFAAAEIEIAGHTDTDPIRVSKWADNYQLSSERARTVRSYFVSKGVAPDRVYISGYGPNRPRSDRKSENRRVEIVLRERT
jgi:flagellar motor protein MotB